MAESQSGVFHSGHNKLNEVFQRKQGFCLDVPVMRISEMVKSNSLDVILLLRLIS